MPYSSTCPAFHIFCSNKSISTSTASSSPKSASFSVRHYLVPSSLKRFSWGYQFALLWLYLGYLEIMYFMAEFFDSVDHVSLVSFLGLNLLASFYIHGSFNSFR